MRRFTLPLSLLSLLAPLAAQQKSEPVTEERLQAAYADARVACEKVLGAKLEELPELKLTDVDEVARVIAAENLPTVRLREPDEEKAAAAADQLGKEIAARVYAKYAWSTRTFLVVQKTWERNARMLRRPELTSDHALRAVMVHELCHALDDRKFDFAKRLLEAKTVDATIAYSAVIEGHAQWNTRRVCAKSGWTDGFMAFTNSIDALPDKMFVDEGSMMLLRAASAASAMAYLDGERFAAAVMQARPETGAKDLFESPPKDAETILEPGWYLDPASRPALLYDVEPAIDAFVAKFDSEIWSSTRNNVTGKQLATGLTMLPQEKIDAVVASLRSARVVQLAPTADPQSKIALLVTMEFDSEDAARRWVAISKVVSDHKDETMEKGILRITGSKTTVIDRDSLRGYLQEKQMKNGRLEFDVSAIDAMKGRLVVETVYSGDPPDAETHIGVVAELFGKIVRRK